jgi:putative nucleotidyltransferase with HDIG domain
MPGRPAQTLAPLSRFLTIAGLLACIIDAVIQAPSDHVGALTIVLAVAAVGSGITVAHARGEASISAGFIVVIVAATFLGVASACAACGLHELAAAWRRKTAPLIAMTNLVCGWVSTIVAGNLIRALVPHDPNSPWFYVVVGAGTVVFLVVNFVLVMQYARALRVVERWSITAIREYVPSLAIDTVVAVAGAGLYLKLGLGGIIFALAGVGAVTYMAHLLAVARTRAQQYVSLSWGVLAGLLRALDIRDGRAARHAAAVARFSRDMAQSVGMSKEDCELAHTAGLLHDIGHFALSDRVAERGRELNDEDWDAIQQHPELGADMLRDLGMYGPVAEIVRAHHERVDGRGYPNGLPVEEIPEIAKIIAVAEVYDTLTASDTYRTPMSSFEALRELRRVAGSQLDASYVEVLAGLLSGEGVEYRHADAADFDSELAMERRINEAASA